MAFLDTPHVCEAKREDSGGSKSIQVYAHSHRRAPAHPLPSRLYHAVHSYCFQMFSAFRTSTNFQQVMLNFATEHGISTR